MTGTTTKAVSCTRHQIYALGVIAEHDLDGLNLDASRKGARLNEARVAELVEKGLVRIEKKLVGQEWAYGVTVPVHERIAHATADGRAYLASLAGGRGDSRGLRHPPRLLNK